jgi:radical SAM modification target selenobiotic family peptide
MYFLDLFSDIHYSKSQAKDGLTFMEDDMDKDHLKQLLAGLCISSLVSGAALLTGCCKQPTSG